MPVTKEGMKQIGGFNVSEEVAQAFKDFCQQNGGSYPQGFTVLMELAKQEDAKIKLADRGACIDEFKLTIQRLLELYTESLELSADAEARASEKVALQLENQATDIKTAREKISSLTAELEIEKEEKAAYLKEIKKLEDDIEKSADKQRIIDMLTVKADALETENKAAREALDKVDQMEKEYNTQIDQLTSELSDLKEKLTEASSGLLIAKKDAETAERQLTEAKKEKIELQSRLDQEREASQKRHDQLFEKLEKEREKKEGLQEQLRQKDQELIKLQMQLAAVTRKSTEVVSSAGEEID